MDVGKLLHLEAIDAFQQRHGRLSFLAAVIKKRSEDEAGRLAALIAYYGFVSMFPLLLVFVTVLGFLLEGDANLREKVEKGTLGQFPLVGDQLHLHSLSGSAGALAAGLAFTLLGGLAITNTLQFAFNRIWSVPYTRRPDFFMSRVRGLGTLTVLALLTILSTAVGGSLGTASHGVGEVVGAAIVALAFNVALFMTLFKLLTAARLTYRQLLPGVVTAAVLWQALQYAGGLYISHELRHNGPLYGTFALVLGLLAWLYLGAQLTLIAAEVNVVLDCKLWPRNMFGEELLDADRRALRASVRAEDRLTSEHIDVRFDEPAKGA
jgi:membrane protein